MTNYKEKLNHLRKRKECWDGYNSPKPNKISIEKSIEFLTELEKRYKFETPSISSDEKGDVFINWGDGTKELDFYVEDKEIVCIQSWGEDINDEMKEYYFDFNDFDKIIELLKWINNE